MHNFHFNLQLFGDGGGAAAPGLGENAGTGADSQVAAGVGEKEQGQVPADNTDSAEESFESLIRGKYKKEYDASVQGILQNRFKKANANEKRLQRFAPLVARLAERYGIDASDIGKVDPQALIDAYDADERLLEEEADREGIPTGTMARMKQLERQASDARLQEQMRQQAEAEAREEDARQRRVAQIRQDSEALRQFYTGFDLDTEMRSEDFRRCLGAGMSLRQAYEAVHLQEIMSGAMAYTAQKTAENAAATVRAGMSRPAEAGVGSRGAAVNTRVDPSKLDRATFAEYVRRVKNGEIVNFD